MTARAAGRPASGWPDGDARAAAPPRSDCEVVLDISRLISRILHATPTGVDRVEMAYARGLAALYGGRLSYAAFHPTGLYGRIPTKVATRFLDATAAGWRDGRTIPGWRRAAAELWRLRPRAVPRAARRRVYVQSSPHHLDREDRLRTALHRERARFVCLLHDLIPIEYPEYARPGGAGQHLRRIRTVATLADAVIANSHATLHAFAPYLREAGRDVTLVAAHLGLDTVGPLAWTPAAQPYYVCLGTIEPRKNHLLLLHLWRRMVETASSAAAIPKLVIVGRRGWENEQVLDLLDRCPALADVVVERSSLADKEVGTLLAGARALLMPSFAEGFGMPVPEALAMGVPVVCSDLPALREAGGDAPVYLDPLDGCGWRAAIAGFVDPHSVDVQRFRHRLAGWHAPTWDDHLRRVAAQIEALA